MQLPDISTELDSLADIMTSDIFTQAQKGEDNLKEIQNSINNTVLENLNAIRNSLTDAGK